MKSEVQEFERLKNEVQFVKNRASVEFAVDDDARPDPWAEYLSGSRSSMITGVMAGAAEVLIRCGIEVIGETVRGRIYVRSTLHKKVSAIDNIESLSFERLLQIAGAGMLTFYAPVEETPTHTVPNPSGSGSHAVPNGDLALIRRSIALVAGYHQLHVEEESQD